MLLHLSENFHPMNALQWNPEDVILLRRTKNDIKSKDWSGLDATVFRNSEWNADYSERTVP